MTNAKRDAAFDKELKDANRCCESCYNFTLNSRITFERGWGARDAEVAELRAQLDELNSALDLQGKVLRRYTEENEALKQQVEEHNRKEVIFQKELTYLRSVIEECVSEMKKEIKTRDEAIEAIADYIKLHNRRQNDWDVQYIYAIEQKLNTLLGRDKTNNKGDI